MKRAPRYLFIALALLLLSGFRLCSSAKNTTTQQKNSATTADEASLQPRSSLTIAAWNIEWLGAAPMRGTVKRSIADYARLKRYADSLAPDIIALSEVDGPEAAARLFDPREYSFHFSRAGGAQRTGFAYRSKLPATLHPDLESLSSGGLRSGTDITLGRGSKSIRLLAVHLKSGCFSKRLDASKACQKFARQVPIVEAWIDERATEGVPFIVLGDFNRVLFPEGREDFVWQEWNDGAPLGLLLWSPTNSRQSLCWKGAHPNFVDHLVLDSQARSRFVPGSFKEHLFPASEAAHRRQLSDHCALSAEFSWTPSSIIPAESAGDVQVRENGAPDARPLKGNITRDGRKLYHAPECPSYQETRIDEAKGERLFFDRAAAEASGFQRAGNCPAVRVE